MSISSDFNQELLYALNKVIPQKSEQANFLMNTLYLGKEAAYRRLRNEVVLSFNEAALLAKNLGFSLDDIISNSVHKNIPSFQLHSSLYGFNKDYKCYYEDYSNHEHDLIFEKLLDDPSVTFISAYDTMPHTILFFFNNLSRFRAFKWHYQQNLTSKPVFFSSVQISDEAIEKHKQLAQKINHANTILIMGRNVFLRLIKEIKYFNDLSLITDEEVLVLKEELFSLIENMEYYTTVGKSIKGNDILIYLSNIDFDSDCVYVKGKDFEQAFINIYQMNSLVSADPTICEIQRKWVESLRKYSTLISVSGEAERMQYFKTQRELLNSSL